MNPSYQFPEGFLWGSATSAHQVEGNNIHSDWWAWEQAGRVKASSGIACDQYQRFTQDFDLAVSLGHRMHRFSVEWSRIEPAEGQWNDEALAHYVEVVRALRSRHLEPVVTLHHFTTPQWLAKEGSWTNPKVVDWFARFTERVVKALGGLVRYWVTINEPMVYVKMHYVDEVGPPGPVSFKEVLRVVEHLIRAHGQSYHVIHDSMPRGGTPPLVSVAKNLPVFVPCRRWSLFDRLGSLLTERFFNQEFLDALMDGHWSVPGIATWRIPEARATLDYLGINFYGRQFIRCVPRLGRFPGVSCNLATHHTRDVPERTLMGWDICPEAFTQTLLRGARLKLPMLVTENGAWLGTDEQRWRFVARHLAAMAHAIDAGARVIGYLYWSLLDNFEWGDGFGPRFGLIETDYTTQARRIRPYALRYADVCRTNRLILA